MRGIEATASSECNQQLGITCSLDVGLFGTPHPPNSCSLLFCILAEDYIVVNNKYDTDLDLEAPSFRARVATLLRRISSLVKNLVPSFC